MRKTSVVIIDAEGRDKGKIFVIKEMPAAVAERWATRALLLLARSGIELPDEAVGAGWAAIAVLGFKALAQASIDEIQPLLDEMWACVSIRPDKRNEFIRSLQWSGPDGEGADIEEVSTMLRLRTEVFNIHAGFLIPGVDSTSLISSTTSTPAASPIMSTSRPSTARPSQRSSPPGKRR